MLDSPVGVAGVVAGGGGGVERGAEAVAAKLTDCRLQLMSVLRRET